MVVLFVEVINKKLRVYMKMMLGIISYLTRVIRSFISKQIYCRKMIRRISESLIFQSRKL